MVIRSGRQPKTTPAVWPSWLRVLSRYSLTPEMLLSEEVGVYTYNLTEPQIIGPLPQDFVFRVYDEHEYLKGVHFILHLILHKDDIHL